MRSASSFLGSVAWRVAAALPGSSSRLQEPELPSSGYEFERGSSARHESASQHGPTVAHLTALLADEILPHQAAEQRLKRLPTEATPPQFTAKDLGQLGAANADALAIKAKAIFSTAELKAKAEAAVKRREPRGGWHLRLCRADAARRGAGLRPAGPHPSWRTLTLTLTLSP